MKRGRFLGYVVAGVGVLWSVNSVGAGPVRINEAVVDPQQDWNGSGSITTSDEWFELYNSGKSDLDLNGWKLDLIDGTNESETLEGIINAGGFFAIENPVGAQNNSGMLVLYDNKGILQDSLTFGTWDDGNIGDNYASGNASGLSDESLSFVEGNWIKTYATPGAVNVPEPGTLGLMALGAGGVSVIGRRKYFSRD